ncbi:hypothetical protein POTOM_035473 [Populus tomentosa]|uniref:MHD domain-containing protein n=1 Tax=Populus tomentosa TaxID=118781 RepID=A0A8X8CM52_POPTO|nr:hypothetical protein POTOM_035473 [Populus tomentosa]
MMDFGYPQYTEAKILSEFIKTNAYRMETSQRPPMAVTNAVSWRSEGINYKKNEVFLDVVESVNILVNSNGQVIRSDVVGALKMRTYLSGMPECKLGLNDRVLLEAQGRATKGKAIDLEDIKFHQCVRLARFENDRTISFIPPDGAFDLMTYRLSTQVKPLIWVEAQVERHSRSRVEIMVKARSQFKERRVLVDVSNPNIRTSMGSASYAPENDALLWKIKSFPGGKEYMLRAEFSLPSITAEEATPERKAPIRVKFEIPYFTVSGIQVRYLKIIEKSGYQALPWIFQRLCSSNFVLGTNGNLGLWACSRSDCSSLGPDKWTSFLGMRQNWREPWEASCDSLMIFQCLCSSNFVPGTNGNLGLWACSRSDCSSVGPDNYELEKQDFVSKTANSPVRLGIRDDGRDIYPNVEGLLIQSLFIFSRHRDSSFDSPRGLSRAYMRNVCGMHFLLVLDLDSRIERLPDELGDLIHLRYLGLYGSELDELPGTLGNLKRLQTLDIRWCRQLRKLPIQILHIQQLRHLLMSGFINDGEIRVPKGIGTLVNLHTLSGIYGGDDIAMELIALTQLRELGVKRVSDDHAILQLLPKLKHLKLCHAYKARHIGKEFCNAGGFPVLETLTIASEFLAEWTEIETGAFPRLRYLFFRFCPNLIFLPEGLQNISTLQDLRFRPWNPDL